MVVDVFLACVRAVRAGSLIVRENKKEKEFHFQNWFQLRLDDLGLNFDAPGRNSYPDFRVVGAKVGFELKGLAYPGRYASFDSNSQVPTGHHNGRDIYYVFGRYPKEPDGNSFPVLDLVVCHGDFLNADREYVHKNKSVKGFGTYGDIMVRDRKMYVLPTPFRLVEGAAHHRTLILPADLEPGEGFSCVGELNREEAGQLVVGYAFDLTTNELTVDRVENPEAGTVHQFRAWRYLEDPQTLVRMFGAANVEDEEDDEE